MSDGHHKLAKFAINDDYRRPIRVPMAKITEQRSCDDFRLPKMDHLYSRLSYDHCRLILFAMEIIVAMKSLFAMGKCDGSKQ